MTTKYPALDDDADTLPVVTKGIGLNLGTPVGPLGLTQSDLYNDLADAAKALEAASRHSETDIVVYQDQLAGNQWKARNKHTMLPVPGSVSADPDVALNAASWELTKAGIDMNANGAPPALSAFSAGGAIEAGDRYWVKTMTNARGETTIGVMVGATVPAGSNQKVTLTDPGAWPAGVTKVSMFRTKANSPTLASHEIPDYSDFYFVGDINAPGGVLVDDKADALLGNNPSEPSLASGGCVAVEAPIDGSDIVLKRAWQHNNQQTFRSIGRRCRLVPHATFDNSKGRAARYAAACGNADPAGALVDAYQSDRGRIDGILGDGQQIAHRAILQKRTKGRNTGTNAIGGDKSTFYVLFCEWVNGTYSGASVGLPNDTNDGQAATSNTWWFFNRMDNQATGATGPEGGPPCGMDVNLGDGHFYKNNIVGGSPPLFINGCAVISIISGHISGSPRGNIRVGGGGCGTLRLLLLYLDNIQGDNTVNPPTGGGICKASGTGTANNWSAVAIHFNLNHRNCDGINAHNLKSMTVVGGDASGSGVPVTAAVWAANVATLTLGAGHGYNVGDRITVQEVNPAGYNGFYTITATTATTVSYALGANPGAYVSGGFTGGNHLFCLRGLVDEENGIVAMGVVGGGGRTLQGWYDTGYGLFAGNAPQALEYCVGSNDGTGMSTRRGVATLANGTQAIVVPHKCLGTPRHVRITPKGDTGAVRWWYDTVGAASFTIRTNVNVGAGVDFDWEANL